MPCWAHTVADGRHPIAEVRSQRRQQRRVENRTFENRCGHLSAVTSRNGGRAIRRATGRRNAVDGIRRTLAYIGSDCGNCSPAQAPDSGASPPSLSRRAAGATFWLRRTAACRSPRWPKWPDSGAVSWRRSRSTTSISLENGRVYLTGTQALVRLPMLQRQRDAAAGLNTGLLHRRLSRFAAGRARSGAVERKALHRAQPHQVSAGDQRGDGGDRGVGQPAIGTVPRRQIRRRLRHVVRQGTRGRPQRRCA